MLFAAVLSFAAHGESTPQATDYDGVVPENRPAYKLSSDQLVTARRRPAARLRSGVQIQELLQRPLNNLDLVTARRPSWP